MKRIRLVLYLCLFLSFLTSMNIWFSWNENKKYINVALACLVMFCILKGKIKLVYSQRNIISFLLLSAAYVSYGFIYERFVGFVAGFSPVPVFFVIICLNSEDKEKCLDYITRWFTYLLIPSLILYLISYVFPIPSVGQVQIDTEYLAYLPYDNYIILVKSLFYLFRFTGPFLEPGHLGMIIMFLLFANRCDFYKWQVVALFIISLFTLSLASYVLFVLCYFFCMVSIGSKTIYKEFFFSIAFLVVTYYIAISYNNGHNYINEMIIERLQYDQDKGFSGNNRVFGQIDAYYDFLLNNSRYFWTGYDHKTIQYLAETGSRGTGYVMYVVQYGFGGLLFTSLFYVYYAFRSKCRKYALFFLLFICMAFWQRCYPFWTSWVMCFVWGINSFECRRVNDT